MPFRDEGGSSRGIGDEVVEHAPILSVDEQLVEVNALDDLAQFLNGSEVVLRPGKALERSDGLEVVAPTLYLAFRACRLPYSLFRSSATDPDPQVGVGHPLTPSLGSRLRRRWATLRRTRLP
jgi:hypothetical protein